MLMLVFLLPIITHKIVVTLTPFIMLIYIVAIKFIVIITYVYFLYLN